MNQQEYEQLVNHRYWPNHLTVPEFKQIVQDSRNLLEVGQRARINRQYARTFVNKIYGDYREVLKH